MLSQDKKRQEAPEAGQGKEGFSPRNFKGYMTLSTP